VYAGVHNIYDATGYSADGDGDGVVNPGETSPDAWVVKC